VDLAEQSAAAVDQEYRSRGLFIYFPEQGGPLGKTAKLIVFSAAGVGLAVVACRVCQGH